MDQLLIALDVDTAAQARALAEQLRGAAGGFKIGSRLFTAEGPALAAELAARGDRVFLDLKFHDIPTTVAAAVRAATRLGAWMLNVHAAGGRDMLRAAREAAHEEAARLSRPAPLVIAVTMLTSLRESTLHEIGIAGGMATQVERLAALAHASGLDGVVASPHEIGIIRRHCGSSFVVVTPGIRGVVSSQDATVIARQDDQSRTMGAADAIAAGATYLVVGRPIVAASDPREAAARIARACAAVRAT